MHFRALCKHPAVRSTDFCHSLPCVTGTRACGRISRRKDLDRSRHSQASSSRSMTRAVRRRTRATKKTDVSRRLFSLESTFEEDKRGVFARPASRKRPLQPSQSPDEKNPVVHPHAGVSSDRGRFLPCAREGAERDASGDGFHRKEFFECPPVRDTNGYESGTI